MSFALDHAALSAVAQALRTAGQDLDSATSALPGAPDAGVASGLLSDILATFTDTDARLTYEAHELGGRLDAANSDYAFRDSRQAKNLEYVGGF